MAQGSFGYGQLTPNDTASEMSVISFICKQMMAQMETMRLVQVKAVHGNGETDTAGTVDVLPLVNQIDGRGNSTAHGTVYGIPWWRLQGGKNAVICDPVVGDIGYVSVSSRDISSVKATRKQSNPGSYRRFDLADGVYVGGVLNVAPDQYVVFTETGVRLVDKNGNSVAMSDSGIVMTDKFSHVVSMSSTGITLKGNVIVDGNLVTNQTLEVKGSATFDGSAVITGSVEFKSGAVADGDLEIKGSLTVDTNLLVKQVVTMQSTLTVNGEVQMDANLFMSSSLGAGEVRAVGNVYGGYGTGGQIRLQNHTHITTTTGNATSSPIPGT